MRKTLMTRVQFAKLQGRTPKAVQNWIKRGHLSPKAFVDGKIWIERAQADLALSLDTRRQNIGTRSRSTSDDDLIRRRQAAETQTAELKAELARHKMAIESGTIMRVDEYERQCAKELADLKANREYFLMNVLTKGIAASFGLDWRTAATEIREHYRIFQTEISEKALATAHQGMYS